MFFSIKEQRAVLSLLALAGSFYIPFLRAQELDDVINTSAEIVGEPDQDSPISPIKEDCPSHDGDAPQSAEASPNSTQENASNISASKVKSTAKKESKSTAKAKKNRKKIIKEEKKVAVMEPQAPKPKRKLQDKMVALVHGPVRSQIFCESDQHRRGIDGRQRSLQDNIAEELGYQKVKEMNAPMDDTMVKEHLNRTVQSFGLKPGDETQIFAQEGYSYAEGFDKFRLMYANNMLTEYFIKQKIMVCEDEVIAYYNANPIEKEPKYKLKIGFVPLDREKGEKARGLEKDIERYIETGSGANVTWSEPSWLQASDLAEHLDFIPQMEKGEIKKQKAIGGFQLYQLEDKKPKRFVSLKKRYRDIVDTLRTPKFETTYQKHQKSLFDSATIVHI